MHEFWEEPNIQAIRAVDKTRVQREPKSTFKTLDRVLSEIKRNIVYIKMKIAHYEKGTVTEQERFFLVM